MIDTQINNNNYSYSYDSYFDVLRLTFRNSDSFFYDEVCTNIYIRYDDETEAVVGLQILGIEKLETELLKNTISEKQLLVLEDVIKELKNEI